MITEFIISRIRFVCRHGLILYVMVSDKGWKKVTNGMRQATVKSKGTIEPTYEGLITKAERTFRSRSLV